MQLKINFLCRDSILAAPVVLDLVLFLDLAQRAGIKIREINIDWYYMPNSKVRPILDSIGMVWDLVRIRWIHRFESRVGDCRIDN